MLNSAKKLVGHDEASGGVFDGRQSTVEGRADVAHQHVCLISIVDLPELHQPGDFFEKLVLQLSCDHRLV